MKSGKYVADGKTQLELAQSVTVDWFELRRDKVVLCQLLSLHLNCFLGNKSYILESPETRNRSFGIMPLSVVLTAQKSGLMSMESAPQFAAGF